MKTLDKFDSIHWYQTLAWLMTRPPLLSCEVRVEERRVEGSWYRHTNNTQPVLCQLKITNDVFLFSRQRMVGWTRKMLIDNHQQGFLSGILIDWYNGPLSSVIIPHQLIANQFLPPDNSHQSVMWQSSAGCECLPNNWDTSVSAPQYSEFVWNF